MVFSPTLSTAAAPAPPMPPLIRYTPQQAYLMALRPLVFVREEPPASNSGQAVEAFLKLCGLTKGYPWCMAVLSYVGILAFGKDIWPLSATAGTNDASDQAKAKGLRYLPDTAELGDIVLLWDPVKKRFRHAFVLEQLPDANGRWGTLEGNTNNAGSAEGTAFLRRTGERGRRLATDDRLIKWHRGLHA